LQNQLQYAHLIEQELFSQTISHFGSFLFGQRNFGTLELWIITNKMNLLIFSENVFNFDVLFPAMQQHFENRNTSCSPNVSSH
jgi:hypothetical protein